ncbi:MAG: hypothetical protein AAF563_10510 [Pseudomonadota bacterium]
MTQPSYSLATVAGAALVMALAVGVRAEAADPLVEACLGQLELTETVCDCIAKSADEKLSDSQRLYVIAELNGDTTTSSQLEGEMTDAEVFDVGDWMDNAPSICEFD